MSAYSLALYHNLIQDLYRLLPNDVAVFDPSTVGAISLYPDCTVKEFAALHLLKSIVKKNSDDRLETAGEVALAKFVRMNEHCRSFTFDIWSHSEPVIQALTWAKSFAHGCVDDSDLSVDRILQFAKFGPGSSIGAVGTTSYQKMASGPLTCTDGDMYSFYMEWMRGSPGLLLNEFERRKAFGRFAPVRCSRTTLVPKTTETDRVICVEPLLNMFIQQGVAGVLTGCLRSRYSTDLKDQQFRNQRLAKLGSEFGRFATIDLESASDTISLSFCDYLLPAQLLDWLKFCRSPRTDVPDLGEIDLHMISSMGNATTFPLQTMIFTSIVLGCLKVLGIKPEFNGNKDGNFGVFGDDIVVPTEAYALVCECLIASGFIPNKSKSFSAGDFRESCGCDYFRGHNVRGVYSKSLLTMHDRYSLINRLTNWSARFGVRLRTTLTYLIGTVDRKVTIPYYEDDSCGIKVPLVYARIYGYNANGSILYKAYRPRSRRVNVGNILVDVKRRHRAKILLNEHLTVQLGIRGDVRDGCITLRSKEVSYNLKIKVSPGWESPVGSQVFSLGWLDAWKHACRENFGDLF